MKKTEKEVERESVAREVYLRLVAQRLGQGWGMVSSEELHDMRLEAHRAADVWVGNVQLAERFGLAEDVDGKVA